MLQTVLLYFNVEYVSFLADIIAIYFDFPYAYHIQNFNTFSI